MSVGLVIFEPGPTGTFDAVVLKDPSILEITGLPEPVCAVGETSAQFTSCPDLIWGEKVPLTRLLARRGYLH